MVTDVIALVASMICIAYKDLTSSKKIIANFDPV